MAVISIVETAKQIKLARRLFVEYAESLGFDLHFQDFQTELENLNKIYARPDGLILLAYTNDGLAGCVAMRRFEGDTCEMKRLYVRPEFRGRGLGRLLSKDIIERARKAGYKKMLLDTLATMTEAIALYKSLGFEEVESYRYNPLEGAKYFELKL